MESFYDLSERLIEYHNKQGYIVGQISREKLDLFYNFIAKGIKALNETKQQDNYTLTAFIEGETREDEDYNRYYRGPYTSIHFSDDQFRINRSEATTKQEENNYLGGLLRLEVSSKSYEALILYITSISSIANT